MSPTKPPSSEIIRHYLARGLTGARLHRALIRHARILAGCDREVTRGLVDYVKRRGVHHAINGATP